MIETSSDLPESIQQSSVIFRNLQQSFSKFLEKCLEAIGWPSLDNLENLQKSSKSSRKSSKKSLLSVSFYNNINTTWLFLDMGYFFNSSTSYKKIIIQDNTCTWLFVDTNNKEYLFDCSTLYLMSECIK